MNWFEIIIQLNDLVSYLLLLRYDVLLAKLEKNLSTDQGL